MARPLKEGLDYFPLDCDMDDKVEILETEYGLEGFAIYIKLLQSIYKNSNGELAINNNGYSLWKTCGKRVQKPPEFIEKVAKFMINIDLFDKKKFQEKNVLTSSGIKKRINAVNKYRRGDRKRKSSNYPDGKQSENSRKRGESKVKESKEKHLGQNLAYADYLKPENLKNLKTIFKDTVSIKKHLLGLNVPEVEIDKALGRF